MWAFLIVVGVLGIPASLMYIIIRALKKTFTKKLFIIPVAFFALACVGGSLAPPEELETVEATEVATEADTETETIIEAETETVIETETETETKAKIETETEKITETQQITEPETVPETETETETDTEYFEQMVWIPKTGHKYHSSPTCSGMHDPRQVTLMEAMKRGYTPCSRCH